MTRGRRKPQHGPLSGLRSTTAGIAGAGICTYAFLTLAGRVLGPTDFTPVSALWALVVVVGPGLFLPLQQELGRHLAPQRAEREGLARASGSRASSDTCRCPTTTNADGWSRPTTTRR